MWNYSQKVMEYFKPKLWLVEENLHLVKGDILDIPIERANELEAKEYVIINNNSIL